MSTKVAQRIGPVLDGIIIELLVVKAEMERMETGEGSHHIWCNV